MVPSIDLSVPAGSAETVATQAQQHVIRDLLALVRPHQWIKNLLVAAPLLHPELWTPGSLVQVVIAVVVFVHASAVVYVANDIVDRRRDREDPYKRDRPLASGRLSVRAALACGAVIIVSMGALLTQVSAGVVWAAAGYLTLNAFYTLGLKHVTILELFSIATGFQLRVITGYLACAIMPSSAILLLVFLASLLLLLGKRRRELVSSGSRHRRVLRGYSPQLIDQYTVVTASLLAATFLWLLQGGSSNSSYVDMAVLLMMPLIILGLFRYIQVVSCQQGDSDPVKILSRDRMLGTSAVLCVLVLVVLSVMSQGELLPQGETMIGVQP